MDFSGGDFHFFQCDLIYLGSLSFFLDESIKVYKFHLFKESAPADNNLAFQRFYFPLKFSIFLSIWLIFFSIKNYNSYFKVLSAYCNVWFIWESVSFGCFFVSVMLILFLLHLCLIILKICILALYWKETGVDIIFS